MRETIQSMATMFRTFLGHVREMDATQRAELFRVIGHDVLRADFDAVFKPLIQAEVAKQLEAALDARFDVWSVIDRDKTPRKVVVRR